jgi:hypothetical protein
MTSPRSTCWIERTYVPADTAGMGALVRAEEKEIRGNLTWWDLTSLRGTRGH